MDRKIVAHFTEVLTELRKVEAGKKEIYVKDFVGSKDKEMIAWFGKFLAAKIFKAKFEKNCNLIFQGKGTEKRKMILDSCVSAVVVGEKRKSECSSSIDPTVFPDDVFNRQELKVLMANSSKGSSKSTTTQPQHSTTTKSKHLNPRRRMARKSQQATAAAAVTSMLVLL